MKIWKICILKTQIWGKKRLKMFSKSLKMGVGEHMRRALRVKWRLDWPEKKVGHHNTFQCEPPGGKILRNGCLFSENSLETGTYF